MNVMETFVIGYQRDSVNDTWGFVNVSFEALEAAFQSADAFYALYPAVSVRGTGYRAAGYDQAAVDCFTLGELNQILADPRVRHAAAVLNLRLMQKGPNVYSRFHCLDLADKVIEDRDPSQGIWV